MQSIVTSCVFGALLLAGCAATAGTIEVRVSNVPSNQGRVFIAVCDQAQFLKKCAHGTSVPSQQGDTVVTIAGIPSGTWAVLAFHDANNNGELDRNLLGIPKEDYGFSRDATNKFGPPKFEAAAIQVGDEPMVAAIKLH